MSREVVVRGGRFSSKRSTKRPVVHPLPPPPPTASGVREAWPRRLTGPLYDGPAEVGWRPRGRAIRVATRPLLALIVIFDAVVVTKVVLGYNAVNNAVGSAGLGASVEDLRDEAPLTTVGGTLRDQLPGWWLMAPKPSTGEEGDGPRSAAKRDAKDRRGTNRPGGGGGDPTAEAASGSFDGTVIGTGSSSGPSGGDGGGSTPTDGSSGGDTGGTASGSGGSSGSDSGGSGPGGSDPDGGGGSSGGGDGGSTGGGGGGG